MATQAGPRPLTEAQRIVERLRTEYDMGAAAIAREIRYKTDTIDNIVRRKTTGNLQLARLRRLLAVMEAPVGPSGEVVPAAQVGIPEESDPAAVSESDPATVTLSGEEPAPAVKRPITERAGDWLRSAMFGSDSGVVDERPASRPPAKRGKGDTGEAESLIEQLVPLTALLFVVSGTLIFPDPYKPCGPNQQEASAIAYPIVKRAVRELDMRKRISEGTMDAVAILLAVSAYGVRAYGTYQAIHTEVEHARATDARQPGDAAAAFGDAGARGGGAGGAEPVTIRRGAGHARPQSGAAGRDTRRGAAGGDERRADAMLDELLRADAAGRQRLGIG